MSLCCRVHTLAVPIAQDLNALYAGADTGAIASIVAKLAVEKSLHGKLEVAPHTAPHVSQSLFKLQVQQRVTRLSHNAHVPAHMYSHDWLVLQVLSMTLRWVMSDMNPDPDPTLSPVSAGHTQDGGGAGGRRAERVPGAACAPLPGAPPHHLAALPAHAAAVHAGCDALVSGFSTNVHRHTSCTCCKASLAVLFIELGRPAGEAAGPDFDVGWTAANEFDKRHAHTADVCIAGLTKSAAFRGSQRDVGVDERVAVAFNIQGASVADILRLAYPSLYALHDPQRAVAGGPFGCSACLETPSVLRHGFRNLSLR